MNHNLALDEKDHHIVDLLAQDAWMTHAKIGESVHLSPSAVQRRISRLRDSGVIAGATATIKNPSERQPLRMYFLLELRNDGRSQLESLVDKLKSNPDIVDVSLLAGRFDILLTIDCEDPNTSIDFAMDSFNDDENILHCWTLTRLKKLA